MEQILNYIRVLGNLKKYLKDEDLKHTIYYETIDKWYKSLVDELKECCDITTIRFIPFREFLQRQEAQINQNKNMLVYDYFKTFLEDFKFMLENELDIEKRKHFEELYFKFDTEPMYFKQFKEYLFDDKLICENISGKVLDGYSENGDTDTNGLPIFKEAKDFQQENVDRKYSEEFLNDLKEAINFINGKKKDFKEEKTEI